jgi:hypothetical protein
MTRDDEPPAPDAPGVPEPRIPEPGTRAASEPIESRPSELGAGEPATPLASGSREPRRSELRAGQRLEPRAAEPPDPAPLAPEPPDLWDRTAAWLIAHGALPALGAVTLAMIALYAGVFRGEPAGDDLTFHMAESARIADCLRIGDYDLWNPSANAGFASAYYYQVVPQLASAIPAAVFGHHLFFFQLSVVLPLILAPAAAYRGMRLLGAAPWQSAIAALAIGFLNGQSRWGTGNAGTFSVGLYTQTWALAAFPIALGHAVRWATQARGLAPAIAWGGLVTLCHPFAGVSLAVALIAGWIAAPLSAGRARLRAAILGRRDRAPDPDRPSDPAYPDRSDHADHPSRPDQPDHPGRPDDLDHPGRSASTDRPGRATPDAFSAAVAWLVEPWRLPPRPWLRGWLDEFGRLAILGACLFVAWLPIWLPLVVDYDGFGGFPHRVSDEVGPGFEALFSWYGTGAILDFARPAVLTWALPVVALFAHAKFLRWLWAPALAYAVWLGLGPHLGKTDDDLIPAVRFLGAMQVALALAIGAGTVLVLRALWNAAEDSHRARAGRIAILAAGALGIAAIAYRLWDAAEGSESLVFAQQLALDLLSQSQARWAGLAALAALIGFGARPAWRALRSQYGLRTGIAALAAALAVLLIAPGSDALESRVNVLSDYEGSHGDELHKITQLLQREPPGRKQVGSGAENHWWNLLSYEYGRRPSLLMMGGGGLQASPNYDFLWTVKDFTKNAWLYDAPILVFENKSADKMPAGDEILKTRHYQARRLPAPGLVSPVQVTGALPPGRKPARAAAIAWLQTEAPKQDRVLAYDGSGVAGGPPHGRTLRSFRQDSPGDAPDIVAELEVAQPTTFMARESWHPRWHAYVDGVEQPIRRVTPDFPAVDVAAGRHRLALRFERPWWLHASWLAWPLVPLIAWLIIRTRRARRPRRPEPAPASEPARPPT